MDLSNQAIKPRGNNIKERFTFLVDWYEKTANNIEPHPNDKYQANLLQKMKDWTPKAKKAQELSEEDVRNWIIQQVAETKQQSGAFEQYLVIELGRVIEV